MNLPYRIFLFFIFILVKFINCEKIGKTSIVDFHILLKRQINSEGFHRDLVYNVNIEPVPSDWESCVICIREILPRGLFVNPDQLKDLFRLGKLQSLVNNSVDVELPEVKSTAHRIYLYGNLTRIEKGVSIVLTLPVHVRYHSPQPGGGFKIILLSDPSLFIDCSDWHIWQEAVSLPCLNNHGRSEFCLFTQLSYYKNFSDQHISVPVGNTDHYRIVAFFTFLTSTLGCVFILFILKHQIKHLRMSSGSGFTFGAPTTTSAQTGFQFGTSSSTSDTPAVGGFSFISSSSQLPATGGMFGTAAAPVTSQSAFTFGTPATSQSSLSFGNPTVTQSGLTFGTPALTQSSLTFGTPSAPQSSLIFGTPPTQSNLTFGSPAVTQSSFTFGSTPTTQSNFSFGTSAVPVQSSFAAPVTTQTGFSFSTPTPTQTNLNFGAPATTTQSTLTFGTPSTTTSVGSFTFGVASTPQQAPGINLGTTTSGAGLTFGTPSTSVSAISSSFSVPQTSSAFTATSSAPSSTGFSFGSNTISSFTPTVTTSVPAPSFTLGTAQPLITTTATAPTLTFNFNPSAAASTTATTTTVAASIVTTSSFTFGSLQAPLASIPLTTAVTTTVGINFNVPTESTTTGLSLGTGTLTLGTSTPTTAQTTTTLSSTPTLSFAMPTTTTTPSTGFTFGTPTTTKSAFSLTSNLGGVTTTPSLTGLFGQTTTIAPTMSTPTLGNLGGENLMQSRIKEAKDNLISDVISKEYFDNFERFLEKQKESLRSLQVIPSISQKIAEEIESSKQSIVKLERYTRQNLNLVKKVKYDTERGQNDLKMSQGAFGNEYDDSTPLEYFSKLIERFQEQAVTLRLQIENTEKYILNDINPMTLTPIELKNSVQKLHECFVSLADRLYLLHTSVATLRHQHEEVLNRYGKFTNFASDLSIDSNRTTSFRLFQLDEIKSIGASEKIVREIENANYKSFKLNQNLKNSPSTSNSVSFLQQSILPVNPLEPKSPGLSNKRGKRQ